MNSIFLSASLLWLGLLSYPARAQSGPAQFPLAGDWNGVLMFQGKAHHLVLHMNTTPEGKMTALIDDIDTKLSGDPAIGGSFDGSRLILRFFYWAPRSDGDFESRVASFEATVNGSMSEMAGVWNQDGSWPVSLKRQTWEAKVPKPAPPTIFDGDWEGVEYEARGIQLHFIFHLHNTEDGLMAFLDCPEERFKGALASKVTYDQNTRRITIEFGQEVFTGKMTADGKALDTSMTEPGFHFLIHFDRLAPKTMDLK